MAIKGGSQISPLHLAIAASGGVLIYAALQDMTPLQALKELTSGKKPTAVPEKSSTLTGGTAQQSSFDTGGTGGSSSALLNAAEKYLGVPYSWGGASAKGVDCSGLVYVAFKDAYGISAPRTTYTQEPWSKLTSVSRSSLQPGDLVFWPGHVAIYAGNGRVLHAPHPGTVVRYENLDSAGPVGVKPSSYKRYKGAVSAPPPERSVMV
jgi:cell wall-associated NlpC family hydrolase